MATDKNPKRMTDMELQAEHVRLDHQVKKLQNHPDQSQSYYKAERLSKRKLLLKEEIDRRTQEREASQRAESEASAQKVETGHQALYATADGAPYRP